MNDSLIHKGQRARLVESLRKKGISNEKVLSAINKVPRHIFFESALIQHAYEDKAFPIGAEQTISQPFTVAFQTQLLDVNPFNKILEIGTGSGYQTMILIELGAQVFTIERQQELFRKSRTSLNAMGYNPFFYYGDGYEGLPTYGPFDRILITAATPIIPEKLISQLKPGGRMVVPLGNNNIQTMKLIVKNEDGSLDSSEHGSFMFVPMIKGKV